MKNSFFYIKNFYYINDKKDIDVSFVPPLVRRKLSLLDKLTLALAQQCYSENIQEIVFSSEYGEFMRLDTIISQYQQAGEVSPSQFSASVHNYPVSFFTLYNKLNIPYQAVSSGENSLAAGIIKSVISPKDVLFIYADVKNGVQGAACVISHNCGKFKAKLENTLFKKSEFDDFIVFLEQKKAEYTSPFGTLKWVLD